MSIARTLNDRQKTVLAWIIDGCPERDWPDETHKHTARALQSRRLVRVSRRDGKWNATATEAGEYYAKNGAYPPGHWQDEAGDPRGATTSGTRARRTRKVVPRIPSPTGRAAARTMIKRLLANGGTLDLDKDDVATHRKLAQTARATPGLLPEGQTIEVTEERSGWKVIIKDLPEPPTTLRVPKQLRNPHPTVAQIRDNKRAMEFTPKTRARALRCLNTLIKAAVSRDYDVTGDGHSLTVRVRGHDYDLHITETNTRSDHVPTAEEVKQKERTGYSYAPRWDYTPTGRLNLKIDSWSLSEPKPRKDGTVAWRLEDRLGEALDHLEQSTVAAEERERERREEEEARQRQFKIDRDNAIVAWTELSRKTVLLKRARAWRDHQLMTDYVEALKLAARGSDDETEYTEWITWATEYLNTHPALAKVGMPILPTPTGEDLEPFMPRRGYRYWWLS